MATLLILGSKPDPVLPPLSSFDHLACSNASGYSAAKNGLPLPTFTVISAFVLFGTESNRQTLEALRGLRTKTIYFYTIPDKSKNIVERLCNIPVSMRRLPLFLRKELKRVSYRWENFISHNVTYYANLIKKLCGRDKELMRLVALKRPSTGIMTLVIGMSLGTYDRYILSGFNFEYTRPYAKHPKIDERGTCLSRHAKTDIRVLKYLSDTYGNIFTTEQTVNQCANVPML